MEKKRKEREDMEAKQNKGAWKKKKKRLEPPQTQTHDKNRDVERRLGGSAG